MTGKKKEDKKSVWEQLAADFPDKAYKKVTFGREYTSLDAYHIVARLTSTFGLCGQGWGFEDLEWKELDKSIVCIGKLWWFDPDNRDTGIKHVQAVGDGAIVKGDVAGAYKKAQTNLMSKAASYIGVGLSLYQGNHMDDPYLDKALDDKPTKVWRYEISDLPKDKLPAVLTYLQKQDAYRKYSDENIWLSLKPLKKLEKYQIVDLPKGDINEILG